MRNGFRYRLAVVGVGIVSVLVAFGCASGVDVPFAAVISDYGAPQVVGRIETDDIRESSGLSASECQDVLWTHNDAGSKDALIFAMGLDGKHLGTWRVQGSQSVDWESIATYRDASGKCSLLIGDIGDNDQSRTDTTIYRIPEPTANAETAAHTSKNPLETAPAETLRFAYVNGPKNAEVLLVQPQTGLIYILTKSKTGPSEVHRLRPSFGQSATTEKVAEISVPSKPEGLLTGGSYSPDGTRVMLCDVKNGYELVLPPSSQPDDIWTQRPSVVDLGERKQGEGVSYGRDGRSLYASSEKKNTPLIRIERRP